MTPEQRLDPVERILKLFAREGVRERRRKREQDEKINLVLNLQVANEDRFSALSEAQKHLTESQIHTDRRLDALIDIVREWRNGRDSTH
jgi:hypothetical protein